MFRSKFGLDNTHAQENLNYPQTVPIDGSTLSFSEASKTQDSRDFESANRIKKEENRVADIFTTASSDALVFGRYTSSPSLSIAPLLQPPIKNGLTATLKELHRILCLNPSDSSHIQNQRDPATLLREVKKIPDLIRRTAELLNAYYAYQVFGESSSLVPYCDIQSIGTLAYTLSLLGSSWRNNKTYLIALLMIPSFTSLVFDDILTLDPRCSRIVAEYNSARKDRPSYGERIKVLSFLQVLHSFRSRQLLAYFVTPLYALLCLPNVPHLVKPEYTEKALRNLVEMSSCQLACKVYGDFPMRTMMLEGTGMEIIDERFQLFIALGGLHTILAGSLHPNPNIVKAVGNYLNRMSDTEIVEALRTESQEGTEKLAITFADQYDGIASDQIEDEEYISSDGIDARNDGRTVSTTRILYCLYLLYSTSFFTRYSSHFFLTFIFSYLSKHLNANSQKYRSFENFSRLYGKFFTLPYGVTQRYAFLYYSQDEMLDPGGPITACMGKRELCRIWNRINTVHDAVKSKEARSEELSFLPRLGRSLKLCGNCRGALYCSRECQKSDWAAHKIHCSKEILDEDDVSRILCYPRGWGSDTRKSSSDIRSAVT